MKLFSLKKICDIYDKISPHATLHTTMGVAVCRNLRNCTEKEITLGLASQCVVVYRMHIAECVVEKEEGLMDIQPLPHSKVDTATNN